MKKLKNGYYQVTLTISEEFARHAEENFEQLNFTSPEDYLTGIFNMAMLDQLPNRDPNTPHPKLPPNDIDDGIPL